MEIPVRSIHATYTLSWSQIQEGMNQRIGEWLHALAQQDFRVISQTHDSILVEMIDPNLKVAEGL